jgi:hypothetical protein
MESQVHTHRGHRQWNEVLLLVKVIPSSTRHKTPLIYYILCAAAASAFLVILTGNFLFFASLCLFSFLGKNRAVSGLVMHRKQRTNKIHSFTPKTWLGTKRKKKKVESYMAI